VKIIQGCGTGARELGILHGARAQIKNQELKLSLNSRTGSRALAISELWPPGPFLDIKGFAK